MPAQLQCDERLSLVVPSALKERVEDLAASLGLSQASLVRVALLRFLESHESAERKGGYL
ncbi:MAG: ribbon-helix-helix domain-containing protein [Actinomycetota bacterium]|nr:ribbon-helix-helix domain-containing protein [Actinomycetota bacterium]